jgi:hypothetical protein
MCSKVDADGLDDEKLKDLTVTNDCECDRFTGKDAFILGGAMGWAYEEGRQERRKRRKDSDLDDTPDID